MNTANTNHNPRIRPRPITSTSTSTSTIRNIDTPFSEYLLFPPTASTSTTIQNQNQNPFVFQSGIPLRNLALGPEPRPEPRPEQVPVQPPSSNFQFQFPLTLGQPQEPEQKTEQPVIEGPEEGEIIQKRDTVFDLTIQETEEHKKNKLHKKLAKAIEAYLEKTPDHTYCLSQYTLFEIDGIQADVYIGQEAESYFYHFIAKNIEYVLDDNSDEDDNDFILIEKNDFDTVVDLLEHIEKVRDTYTFLDFYLLSPEKKETVRLHRSFLPLPPDKTCSVCYEPTVEYTTCKHPICLKCREKCIVNERKMCPVCRSSQLRFYPTELAKL